MRRVALLRAKLIGVVAFVSLGSFAFADDCSKQLQKLTDVSAIIVSAKVIQVGIAPGFWSGLMPAIQPVKYAVVQVLKGKLPGDQIEIDHRVKQDSSLTEKHPPGLSRKIFASGNQLILFLQSPKHASEGDCAVRPFSNALDQQIRGMAKLAQ